MIYSSSTFELCYDLVSGRAKQFIFVNQTE